MNAGSVLFSAILFASTLWAVIRITDRDNRHNSFLFALVLGLLISIAGAFDIAGFGIAGLGILVILVKRYELGLMHAVGVMSLLCAVGWLISMVLEAILGSS